MCNNRRINQITKREEVRKDRISDWLEKRRVLPENRMAKKFKKEEENKITYSKKHPLKLHNGTEVYEISSISNDGKYQEIRIKFKLNKSNNEFESKIKRYSTDKLNQVEEFIENSQSTCQLVNIDLDWK